MQAHAACHITGLFRMLSRHPDSVQDPRFMGLLAGTALRGFM